MPAEFHFLRPWWLLALLPLGLLIWRLARTRGNAEAWRKLVDAHLLPGLLVDTGSGHRRLPLVLLALGGLLLTLALAGPTWTRLPQPVYQAQQYRVIALDLSPSMNAADRVPSRLAQARFEVLDLLRRQREGQTALLAYGPEPFVVSPLTNDVATIALQVPALQTDLLPQQGPRRTDLALDEAGRLLQQAGAPGGEVILVSDGLRDPARASAAAQRLRENGYQVSVLGVGTAQGAPVKLPDGGFLKESDGAIRVSRLDETALRALALAGGGRYVTAGAGDGDIAFLSPDTASANLAAGPLESASQADLWREEGPWLLVLLLPLAALAFRRGWLSPLLILVVAVPGQEVHALDWDTLWSRPDQQAMQRLDAGNPAQAAQLFEQPAWQAAAHYQAGDYAAALRALHGLQGPDAEYNRGNALARSGRLEEAVAAYDRALQQAPDNQDAQHNRDLVARLLQQQSAQDSRSEVENPDSEEQRQEPDSSSQDQQSTAQQQPSEGQQGEQQQQQGAQGDQETTEDQGQGQEPNEQGQQGQLAQEPAQEQDTQGAQEQAAQEILQDSDQGEQPQPAQQAASGEPQPDDAQAGQEQAQTDPDKQQQAAPLAPQTETAEPGMADLLAQNPQPGEGLPTDMNSRVDPEQRQAMEQMLRRVPDDPAGLLRQRFWLQHLRRQGRLPEGE